MMRDSPAPPKQKSMKKRALQPICVLFRHFRLRQEHRLTMTSTISKTCTGSREVTTRPWMCSGTGKVLYLKRTKGPSSKCRCILDWNKSQTREVCSKAKARLRARARVRAHFLESYHAPLVSGPGSVWDLEPWEGVYGTLHWEGSGAPEL